MSPVAGRSPSTTFSSRLISDGGKGTNAGVDVDEGAACVVVEIWSVVVDVRGMAAVVVAMEIGGGVGVWVGVLVGVGDGVGVGVGDGVGVGVLVGTFVGVGAGVGVSVGVLVGVGDGDGVWVGVSVGVGDGLGVREGGGVDVRVGVGSGEGVRVAAERATVSREESGVGLAGDSRARDVPPQAMANVAASVSRDATK